jgi:hypothetical protein
MGTTFLAHAQASADDTSGGRFGGVNKTVVVGADPIPRYPALPSGPWSGSDPVPDEPSLGYDINQLDPSALRDPAEVTGDPAHAPSGGSSLPSCGDVMSERAGSSSFEEQANE